MDEACICYGWGHVDYVAEKNLNDESLIEI